MCLVNRTHAGVGGGIGAHLTAEHEEELRAYPPLFGGDVGRRFGVRRHHRAALLLEQPFSLENHHLLTDSVALLLGVDGKSGRGHAARRGDLNDEGVGFNCTRLGARARIACDGAIDDHVAGLESERFEIPLRLRGPLRSARGINDGGDRAFLELEALAGAGHDRIAERHGGEADIVSGFGGNLDGAVAVGDEKIAPGRDDTHVRRRVGDDGETDEATVACLPRYSARFDRDESVRVRGDGAGEPAASGIGERAGGIECGECDRSRVGTDDDGDATAFADGEAVGICHALRREFRVRGRCDGELDSVHHRHYRCRATDDRAFGNARDRGEPDDRRSSDHCAVAREWDDAGGVESHGE